MLEPYRVQRKDRRTLWFGVGVQELNFLDSSPDISPCELGPVPSADVDIK